VIFEEQLAAMVSCAMKNCARCKRAFVRICITCDCCVEHCSVDADPQRSHYDDWGGMIS
jgi:hypothetical protein